MKDKFGHVLELGNGVLLRGVLSDQQGGKAVLVICQEGVSLPEITVPAKLLEFDGPFTVDDAASIGQVAYEAYCASVGGKSSTGEPLPSFEEISRDPDLSYISRSWQRAALAVKHAVRERERNLSGAPVEVQAGSQSPPAAPESFQDRVVRERLELVEKHEKLGKFLDSPTFNKLPQEECGRLRRQYLAMADYSDVLGERISNFEPPKITHLAARDATTAEHVPTEQAAEKKEVQP